MSNTFSQANSGSKDSLMGFVKSFLSLSLPKKVSVVVILLAVLMLPLIVYVSRQVTEMDGRAAGELATPPVPNEVFLEFAQAPGTPVPGQPVTTNLYLDTHGRAVDGVQLVAYVENNPGVMTFPTSQNSLEWKSYGVGSVIGNYIEFQPEMNRYKIVFALISNNPAEPINVNREVIGSFIVNPVFGGSEYAVLNFDQAKTKVIDHLTGENLAQNLPTLAYYFAITPTATSEPTSAPTSSPTPAPLASPTLQPTATPTPGPQQTYLQLKMHYSDEIANSSIYPNPPVYQDVLRYAGSSVEVPKTFVSYKVDGQYVVLVYQVPLGSTEQFDYTVKLDKHLSTMTKGIAMTPGTTKNVTIYNNLPGDFNNDFVNDLDDYHLLVLDFDPIATPSAKLADINYDGLVDITDYGWWASYFNPEYESPSLNL